MKEIGDALMGNYSVKKELTLDDYLEMQCLEADYYSEDHITPAEEAARWRCHNPWTGVVLTCDNEIIGFVDVLPVSEAIFNRIEEGTLNDREMTTEHFLSEQMLFEQNGAPMHLFFSCAVIRQDFRGSDALGYLLKAYLEQLHTLLDRGVVFQRVAGDCVTEEGERFSRKIGLTYLCDSDHGTRIYSGSFDRFLERITALAVKE
jgi:hypothetical protein